MQSRRFSQSLAKLILGINSWKLDVEHPSSSKFVLIGAPHTSNWDFLYFLLLRFGSGIELNWVGKHTLFRWPVGPVMRMLGGVPVDRSGGKDFVAQIVDRFNQVDRFAITLAPEGTRRKTDYWKTGFYYIALGAGVPVVLGFVDYTNKTVGIGPEILPTGDIEADFDLIRAFYSQKTGKFPDQQGEIQLRPGFDSGRQK
jgi:1-acyl-sn-glycerol-3-phosphate acyltransferase